MATPYRQAVFDEDLRRKLSAIFPGQSLTSMQPVSASSQDISTPDSTFTAEATIPQEPIQSRTGIDDYMRIQSAINRYESKQDAMPNLIRKMVGRSGSLPATGASSSADLRYIMGQTDEGIQNEILNRQRAAILGGEISNIDEQMAWYQKGGYDPHFAKTAREAAQSIFDQRFQETEQVRAGDREKRQVRDQEMSEIRLKHAIADHDRKVAKDSSDKTTESRNELKTSRENLLLRWAAKKWWDLEPEERTEAKREEIGREMTVIAENPNFQRFDGDEPFYGRDQYTVAPSPVDLDEKSLLDTFRNEAKVVLKDADAEDEDFVTVPALTYSDRYEDEWRTAADDFETATKLGSDIRAAIRADDSIAQENKQAVLEKVLKNLESVEKGVGRPTEPTIPAMLKNQEMFESMVQVAPFPVGGELSTPENIREAQNSFTRTLQMMERTGRASNEYLAQLVDPMFKDRMYREMTAMKAMHPDSRSIAMNNNSEPNLVAMRNAVGAINERLSDGKYKNDEGKTVKLTDADRMNLEGAKLIQFQKYADYWGVTPDYALHRYDPEAYRKRNPNL